MLAVIMMSPGELAAELGSRLKARRLSLRVTQEELAERAGLSVGTVKNLEAKAGASALDTVIRVSIALGLADHFEPLFVVKPRSIAQMEQLAEAPRQRARRSRRQ
jgi:transcriptional regulator with XRE-family HTH domain